MVNTEFECPVCNAKLNSQGKPFNGVRAIALHIAHNLKSNDNAHIIWAYQNRGEEEIDRAIAKYKATGNNNVLARLLYLPLQAYFEDKGKPDIGFKKY